MTEDVAGWRAVFRLAAPHRDGTLPCRGREFSLATCLEGHGVDFRLRLARELFQPDDGAAGLSCAEDLPLAFVVPVGNRDQKRFLCLHESGFFLGLVPTLTSSFSPAQ